MPINLKPPWKLYPPLLRGIFMLAFIIFAGMAATMEAHAEEPDAWYKSFFYELDDTGCLITLTGVNEGVEDVVIEGSASIDGKEYHTLVDSDLFQSSDKEAIKSIVFESGVSFPACGAAFLLLLGDPVTFPHFSLEGLMRPDHAEQVFTF